jgi:hypothetical protein
VVDTSAYTGVGSSVGSRWTAYRPSMVSTDWSAWHDAYSRPGSGLADRLTAVRGQIVRMLDATSPHPVRVVSACAGDGRDLLGVLAGRPDAGRVSAVLVENDAALVARANEAAEESAARVEVRQGDAGRSDAYVGAAPADLVLLCGIFGNVSDLDVRRTVEAAPQLCAPGAEVIWTRHRAEPDLTGSIRRWFADVGFEEVAFMTPAAPASPWSVGVHRLAVDPAPLEPGRHWFTFFR